MKMMQLTVAARSTSSPHRQLDVFCRFSLMVVLNAAAINDIYVSSLPSECVQNYRALCLSGQIDRSMYVDFWSWASEKRSADGDDIKVCAAGGRCKV